MAGTIKKTTPPTLAAVADVAAPEFEKAVASASAPVAEMQEGVRKAVEKTMEDTRAAYANVKSAAEEATGALEASYSTAAKGIVEFNTKAVEALRVNAEASFDLVKSMIAAKSVADIFTLQTEHARKQAEAFTAQAKDIAALARKIAADSAEPIKSQVAKTLKIAV